MEGGRSKEKKEDEEGVRRMKEAKKRENQSERTVFLTHPFIGLGD